MLKVKIIAKCSEASNKQSEAWYSRDVVPGGDVTRWYLVAALQSRPRERQMYVTVLAPRGLRKFGTRDLHLLLGVSKYVSNQARYF